MPTIVVNAYREKFDVYIGREPSFGYVARNQSIAASSTDAAHLGMAGTFGNPYFLPGEWQRDMVIAKFKQYFWRKVNDDPEFRGAVRALEGRRLGCFCKPESCHGDIIADWLEAGCPLAEEHK